jgi:hypothetical protein
MTTSRISCFLLASPAFLCLPALAQHSVSVPVEIVQISNPDLTAESRGSVTLFRIHPQYTLQVVDGSSRTELSLGGLVEKSSNTDLSANRTLPSVRVLWENSTPLSVFGLRASLEEASTRETEFAEFGRVTRDSKARTGTVGGTWNRSLSPGTSLELEATHSRVSYDTAFFVDYSETRGAVAYRFDTSPDTRYSLTGSVARLNPAGSGDSTSRGEVGLGYRVNLQGGFTLNAGVGAVRTNTSRSKTDPVGSVRLSYMGERLGYAVGWSREVAAGGSVLGYTRSENVDASLTYPFTADTSLSLGLSHAKSLETNGDAGSIVYARIRSELSRFWAFTVGLEQRRAKPFDGPGASGNWISVGLVYAHPDL